MALALFLLGGGVRWMKGAVACLAWGDVRARGHRSCPALLGRAASGRKTQPTQHPPPISPPASPSVLPRDGPPDSSAAAPCFPRTGAPGGALFVPGPWLGSGFHLSPPTPSTPRSLCHCPEMCLRLELQRFDISVKITNFFNDGGRKRC